MTTVRNEAPEPRTFLVEVQLKQDQLVQAFPEDDEYEEDDPDCWSWVEIFTDQGLAEKSFDLKTKRNPERNYRVIEVLLQSSSAVWEETES